MTDDFLKDLGLGALGSRLRRLTERLNAGVAAAYAASGVAFEPGWYGLFRLIEARDGVAIGDASVLLSVSHPTVVQTARALARAGLVEDGADQRDRRRRLLRLTAKGRATAEALRPAWAATEAAAAGLLEEAETDLLAALERLEAALARRSYAERIAKEFAE